ncbi:MAG: YraN family protein [Rhodocyclaceae bacterium]|jgi:putative endonuclease|nr:YraN family protein [Rhodocyclaceae bacterium]MCE2980229.1 YraN family protein [Betaproteobacteria bacterium]MCA3075442.1 YraN family protein [Rhodocyclaceae bacterium]MCA3091927.1 YraN family protein [Rhodocyclaceae bacterium]MCA3093179.1 YraN family protein [Rhodocyclaceae bacterium]
MARTTRQADGHEGEDQAAAHLAGAGLRVLSRNWRCRAGELDIVARDADGTLVFVEVRRRASAAFGGAAASITPAKQLRLARAAELYRQVMRCTQQPCRFDVVLIESGRLEWIRDAFQPGV